MQPQSKPPSVLKKLLWFLPIAVLIASYSVSLLQGTSNFYDQAAAGRWIWTTGRIPHHTLFLWSARQQWIAHSWLSELFMFSMMRVHGDAVGEHLAILWCLLMCEAAFGLLFLVGARHVVRPWPLLVTFGLAVYAASPRFQPRAELFSDLATVTLLLLLVRGRWDAVAMARTQVVKLGASIVLLFILWTNLHGAVLYGLVLLGLQALGDLLQDRWTPQTRRLTFLFCLCLLAVAVNPYGFQYYRVFLPIRSLVFSHIKEWQPPFPTPVGELPYIGTLACVFALACVSWARGRERRVSHLLWLLFSGAAFLMSRRNIITLVLVCLAVYSAGRAAVRKENGGASAELPGANAALLRWASLVGTLLTLGAFCYALAASPLVALPWPPPAVLPISVPMAQLAFLKQAGITGRLFNPYGTASYYEWKTYGDDTFFIDSINAYPDSLVAVQEHVLSADEVGMRYLDQNGIDCVIASRADLLHGPAPLYQRLSSDAEWVQVYDGLDGPVWVRRTARYRTLWARNKAL